LRWPHENGWDVEQLETTLIPSGQTPSKIHRRTSPDFGAIRQDLQRHRNLTLQLVWEEYRQDHPDGYSYSRYVVAEFMLRDDLKAMTDARHR
jgi:transposase